MKRRDFLSGLGIATLCPAVGRWISSAGAVAPGQSSPIRPPNIAFDIEHAKTTTPIPGAEIFPMPHSGTRTDTRSALARNGDLYVGGGGYLWKSTDRGETWNMTPLPQRAAGGFGILNGDIFILVLYSSDHATNSVLRSTDFGKTWSEPTVLDS